MNALYLAINEFNEAQLEWLLEHGAGEAIHLPDSEGNTALMLAVRTHLEERLLQQILEYGVDIQARNERGMTALLLALDHHNLNAAKRLLDWHDRQNEPIRVDPSLEQGRLAL
jgi:ankyrin repeat protein